MSDERLDFCSKGGVVLNLAEYELQQKLMFDDPTSPETFFAENTPVKRFITIHKLVEIAVPEHELCNLNMNYMIGRFIDTEKFIHACSTLKIIYYGFLAKYVSDTKIAVEQELARRAHLENRGGIERNGMAGKETITILEQEHCIYKLMAYRPHNMTEVADLIDNDAVTEATEIAAAIYDKAANRSDYFRYWLTQRE